MPGITSLLTPKEMSTKVKGVVSPARLLELAESKLIPHYIVDDNVYFGASETREWLDHNFVVRHPGQQIGNGLATIINVVAPSVRDMEIPIALRAVANFLIPMELESIESPPISGIYFLCSQGVVVYVGQSVNVTNRVGQHFGVKTFDSVFFMRVPESDLNYVEGAFIRSLQPKYNWTSDGKRIVAPSGEGWRDKQPSSQSVELASAIQAP